MYALFKDGEIHAINIRSGEEEGVLKINHGLLGAVTNAEFTSRGIVANEFVIIATFNDKNVWALCEPPCF